MPRRMGLGLIGPTLDEAGHSSPVDSSCLHWFGSHVVAWYDLVPVLAEHPGAALISVDLRVDDKVVPVARQDGSSPDFHVPFPPLEASLGSGFSTRRGEIVLAHAVPLKRASTHFGAGI